jgi:hypothetical protein
MTNKQLFYSHGSSILSSLYIIKKIETEYMGKVVLKSRGVLRAYLKTHCTVHIEKIFNLFILCYKQNLEPQFIVKF